MIRYVDSSGWTWEVCELADAPPDEAHAADRPPPAGRASDAIVAPRADAAPDADATFGELYFFSRLGTRKLREYPAAWSQLARADLEALCEGACEVGRALLADRAPA